ncbi:uncharacterized protein LOC142776564 isoform X2 [Rhipicephalus microplus]|uniref:uncharacterized protein LOC142776564 isoform X2 n=1 Tax=Rhipicephalus microplus TaxID=6941 RepID=UPI003F6B69F9
MSEERKTAAMVLSLPVNARARSLGRILRRIDIATGVLELDVSNCVLADLDVLIKYVGLLSSLRLLRCLTCPIPASHMLSLLQHRLTELEEIDFSLIVSDEFIESEVEQLSASFGEHLVFLVPSLRRVYVEVNSDGNVQLLWWLLHFCPYVTELHVHVLSGEFQRIVYYLNDILLFNRQLEKFTFTSDIPPMVHLPPHEMTDFHVQALVCANVCYWNFFYSCCCVWLRDYTLVTSGQGLSSQLVVVFTDEADVPAERISVAIQGHDWTAVHHLCLVLLPQQPFSFEPHPMAGMSYLNGLHEFFLVLQYLVELNVHSFHFGPDVDLMQLLGDANLMFLQALSVAPCGLHHSRAVYRLAQACRELVELDVRVIQRGAHLGCTVCQLPLHIEPDDVAELHDDFPRSRRMFLRLTLSAVPNLASLRFLMSCKVQELRLVDCRLPSFSDFVHIGGVLGSNGNLRSLVLGDSVLPLGTTELIDNLTSITRLEYLCLLTDAPVSHETAIGHAEQLGARLPKLSYLHVHYRHCVDGSQQKVSWIRPARRPNGGHVVVNGPCVLCSTATFIGLNKPRNRR